MLSHTEVSFAPVCSISSGTFSSSPRKPSQNYVMRLGSKENSIVCYCLVPFTSFSFHCFQHSSFESMKKSWKRLQYLSGGLESQTCASVTKFSVPFDHLNLQKKPLHFPLETQQYFDIYKTIQFLLAIFFGRTIFQFSFASRIFSAIHSFYLQQ